MDENENCVQSSSEQCAVTFNGRTPLADIQFNTRNYIQVDERCSGFRNKRKVDEYCNNKWLRLRNREGSSSLAYEKAQQKETKGIPPPGLVSPGLTSLEEQPHIIFDTSKTRSFRTTGDVAQPTDINGCQEILITENSTLLGYNTVSQVTSSKDDARLARMERAFKIAKKRKRMEFALPQGCSKDNTSTVTDGLSQVLASRALGIVNAWEVKKLTSYSEDKENHNNNVVDQIYIDQEKGTHCHQNQVKSNVSGTILAVSQSTLSPLSKESARHARLERALKLPKKKKETIVSQNQKGTISAITFTPQTTNITSMEGYTNNGVANNLDIIKHIQVDKDLTRLARRYRRQIMETTKTPESSNHGQGGGKHKSANKGGAIRNTIDKRGSGRTQRKRSIEVDKDSCKQNN
ncbi:hypothetical protein S83_071023, partial [Arachis hypogaea]